MSGARLSEQGQYIMRSLILRATGTIKSLIHYSRLKSLQGVTSMSMTKIDYLLVANAINLAMIDGTDYQALREVASALANQFSKDNSKFDRQRFLEQCGVK